MKAFPVRGVRKLIREVCEAIKDDDDLGIRFEIGGTFDVDNDGEFGLVASADLPVDLPVDVGTKFSREYDSSGAGWWRLEMWSPVTGRQRPSRPSKPYAREDRPPSRSS